VQLLYWGPWWQTPDGQARQALISSRTQAVIDSEYFSELAQYGIAKPHWRGDLIVLQPAPPMAFNSDEDSRAVPEMVLALLEDDVMPDPDDERLAFVVLMPKGFTQSIGANGAHTYDTDYEFPFDEDAFWVSWVRSFGDTPGEDPEDAVRTLTHELVELFTDPEMDAWFADPAAEGELADAAESGGTKQTAWVNGAHVSAYWSLRHDATVIPIDRDYRARILGSVRPDGRRVIDRGTFRPDPNDTTFCEQLPVCCLPDRDFWYQVDGVDETARLRVETTRYRSPRVRWSISGVEVSGSGSLNVDVFAQTFVGRKGSHGPMTVSLAYSATDGSLSLSTSSTGANFDVPISCTVEDASITGNVRTQPIATPGVTVGFVGADLSVDPEYTQKRRECEDAVRELFDRAERKAKFHRPRPGEPVELDPLIMASLPAFARKSQYEHARQVVMVSFLAPAVVPAHVASALTASLVADVPALAFAAAVSHGS
jgi:hypothetical protein